MGSETVFGRDPGENPIQLGDPDDRDPGAGPTACREGSSLKVRFRLECRDTNKMGGFSFEVSVLKI